MLLRGEFGLSAAVAALGACRAEACLGPFPDHGALELGEGAQHLHHHAARCRCAVDVFGQRAEAGACFLDLVQDEQQVLQRARQPVEFPDGEDIAGREPVEQAVQFGAVSATAREAFLIDALAARGLEGLDLGGGVLVFGFGHASVAKQDGRCCISLLRLLIVWQQLCAAGTPLFSLGCLGCRTNDRLRTPRRR